MKNRGFTLIELLAVIVILAIIALIATPIILNIIENAREEANKRSIELYASAIKNGIAAHQLRTGEEVLPNTYTSKTLPFTVEYDGDVECNTIQIKEDGTIYVGECTVNDQPVEYAYGIKEEAVAKPCTYVDSSDDTGEAIGTIDLSDVVTCGIESFYVMENDGSNITMLSMYNLNVGDNAYPNGTIGIQNENVFGKKDSYNTYGNVSFYQISNENLLSKYEAYLKEEISVSGASVLLMSYEQANDLKNNQGNPSWLYNTSFWTSSLDYDSYYEIDYVIFVQSDGYIRNDVYGFLGDSGYVNNLGVRPVITISTNEIQ